MALQLKNDGSDDLLDDLVSTGNDSGVSDDDFDISISRAEPERRTFKSQKRNEKVRNSFSYTLSRYAAEYFDDLINIGPIHIGIDPILGFIIPGFGDLLTQMTTVPAMYCALFRLHSVPLFLACVYNSLKDWLVGLFPLLGDILDCFVRSNRANFRLLTGFVDDDPDIKDEVNGKAAMTAFLIVILGLVIYGVISMIGETFDFIWSLF